MQVPHGRSRAWCPREPSENSATSDHYSLSFSHSASHGHQCLPRGAVGKYGDRRTQTHRHRGGGGGHP